jgi:hypothetical protein
MLKSGGVVSPARETLARAYVMKKLAQETTRVTHTNQTPFERLKTAMSTVLSVPKSSLPKPRKKPHKK